MRPVMRVASRASPYRLERSPSERRGPWPPGPRRSALSCRHYPARPRWRLPSSSSGSATATTFACAARPGRGCRSLSASRCFRSSAGWEPSGPCRHRSGCSFRRRCSRARRLRSPTPEPTTSAISQRARLRSPRHLDCSGPGSSMPRYWESCSSSPSAPWRQPTFRHRPRRSVRRGGPRHVRDGREPSGWSGRSGTGLGTRGDRCRCARRGVGGRRHRRGDHPLGVSARRRRSGPSRSRSRDEASRSSGTWRGLPDRSSRWPRGTPDWRPPRPVSRPPR